ncbi:MAG TPA: glycosyltransferase [Spirochaetota bacterium]|nr:glycosyltransferase [Spirochaetota bacterium]
MSKVSVILSSFNHEEFLRDAIDSALTQTFEDFELLIWDDASKDTSWDIINTYKDHRIHAVRNDEQRRGIWGINKAITEIAVGEYIAIHHSDDLWEPEKLAEQVAYLDAHPDIGAVFTKVLPITEDGSPLSDPKHFYSSVFEQPNRNRHEWLRFFFERGNALCHPSVLIRRKCYEDCGLYRFGLAQLGDFDMWIRLCLKYEIHILDRKLTRFRVRAGELNTSGDRPEVRTRSQFEFFHLLKNFLLLDRVDLEKVFPEAVSFSAKSGWVKEYVLGRVFLMLKPYPFAALFGAGLLFEIVTDPEKAAMVREQYGFDYRDCIALTGQYDFFSTEEFRGLWLRFVDTEERMKELAASHALLGQALSERERQIAEYERLLAERDLRLADRDMMIAGMYRA